MLAKDGKGFVYEIKSNMRCIETHPEALFLSGINDKE